MTQHYARVVSDAVIEIWVAPAPEVTPAEAFHPDFPGEWHACPPDVEPGWRRVGSSFEAPAVPAIDLAELKASLKAGIDAAAEQERLKYITAGAGQAMTYQAKAEEARRLALVPEGADPADYPLLAAEIGITAETLAGVGDVVRAAYQQWLAIGAAIEAVRLGAKLAIDAAVSAEDALSVEVAWPQP
jgi:hypothetical protein